MPSHRPSSHALGNSLLWLLRLRWIALVFLAIASLPALSLGLLQKPDLPVYYGALGVLAVVNVWTQMQSLNLDQGTELPLLFHLGIDVLCLSLILSLMGGAWNPLSPLLYFHAALGGLLLRRRSAWLFLGIIAFCFFLLNLVMQLPPILEASPVPRYIQLPSQLLVAFAIWALTRWLSAKLEDSYKQNLASEEQKSRLDKLRAAGALSAGFSHEFATPLNTLRMRMERIFRKNQIDADDESVSKESLSKCEEILRKMSATHSNQESIRIECVEMNQFIHEIARSWNRAHEMPKVEVLAAATLRAICEVPPIPFTNAILALLDNSREALAAELRISIDLKENFTTINIRDSGGGWPSEVIKHFGQPFLSLKKRGSGLGLYNAKTLVEALGGRLEIFNSTEAAPYCGAGLEIAIPLSGKVGS